MRGGRSGAMTSRLAQQSPAARSVEHHRVPTPSNEGLEVAPDIEQMLQDMFNLTLASPSQETHSKTKTAVTNKGNGTKAALGQLPLPEDKDAAMGQHLSFFLSEVAEALTLLRMHVKEGERKEGKDKARIFVSITLSQMLTTHDLDA